MARVWFRLARLDDAPALTLVHDLSRASAVPALPRFMADREALERWIAQRYIAPALRHRAGIPDPAGLEGMAFADCPGAPHVEIAMVGRRIAGFLVWLEGWDWIFFQRGDGVTSRDVTEEWREWGGPSDAALVRMLYIAPEFQRRGIGRRLLRRLRRRRMAASIGLHVFEVNRAGIAFWEREGFRRGNLPAVPSTGGAPLVRLDWWRGMPRHESAATDGQRRGLA